MHDQTFESLHQSQKLRRVEISKKGDGDETPPHSSMEDNQSMGEVKLNLESDQKAEINGVKINNEIGDSN